MTYPQPRWKLTEKDYSGARCTPLHQIPTSHSQPSIFSAADFVVRDDDEAPRQVVGRERGLRWQDQGESLCERSMHFQVLTSRTMVPGDSGGQRKAEDPRAYCNRSPCYQRNDLPGITACTSKAAFWICSLSRSAANVPLSLPLSEHKP
eukprot:3494025-Rhodomonas_salina.2